MKSHLLPLTTAALLAVRLTGLAAVPYAVVFAPLAVMVVLALIYMGIALLNNHMMKKALAELAGQMQKVTPGKGDNTTFPGLYL